MVAKSVTPDRMSDRKVWKKGHADPNLAIRI